jgi:two-component system response regulator WspF
MRIGIVNDTPFAVIGLRRTLALRQEHQVAWIAGNGQQAVEMCAKDRPDLVLMDLVMPVMDGVEATRRIMTETPCAILIVTASVGTHATKVFDAMGHGALDAVNTPELGLGDQEKTAAPFLSKLNVISRLIGEKGGAGAAVHRPPGPPRRRDPLIGVGASAGGPAAICTLLAGLPKDFPAAVVVVQHVDEHIAAGMAEWMSHKSGRQVRVAQEGDRVQAGAVLLAGSFDHLTLKSPDRLGYTPDPADVACRPSLDVFFHSMSEMWPGEGAGVLLTGLGDDGAAGLKSLREKGLHTIAQDQATSAVFAKPKAAIAMDAAVDVLPISGIAPRLVEILSRKVR